MWRLLGDSWCVSFPLLCGLNCIVHGFAKHNLDEDLVFVDG